MELKCNVIYVLLKHYAIYYIYTFLGGTIFPVTGLFYAYFLENPCGTYETESAKHKCGRLATKRQANEAR